MEEKHSSEMPRPSSWNDNNKIVKIHCKRYQQNISSTIGAIVTKQICTVCFCLMFIYKHLNQCAGIF